MYGARDNRFQQADHGLLIVCEAGFSPLPRASTGPDRRFPAVRRLKDPADFQRVFRKPVKLGTPEFTVYARRNGLDHARLGLAVSRRVSRAAVGRNRIKRIIRESFRHCQQSWAGWDVIFVARAGATQRSNQQLFEILDQIWARLAKRCENSSPA